jgi:hypothetical protein
MKAEPDSAALIDVANSFGVKYPTDEVASGEPKTIRQQSATPAQPGEGDVSPDVLQVVEGIGGGGWTRTNDLRIMRPSL